jgi:hypothetical protein
LYAATHIRWQVGDLATRLDYVHFRQTHREHTNYEVFNLAVEQLSAALANVEPAAKRAAPVLSVVEAARG